MNYAELKKLDEETLKKLTEGLGPSDECLCSILSPPENKHKSITASIKKALTSMGRGVRAKKRRSLTGQNSVEIPLTFTAGGHGVYSTKEAVKRTSPCGKCGCDNENIVLKHSYASIRITTPDVSSICPCPTDCLPDKHKLANNIKVTIEHIAIPDIDAIDSEFSVYEDVKYQDTISEPEMERRPASELLDDIWWEPNESSP